MRMPSLKRQVKFLDKRTLWKSGAGFTLIELMVVLVIFVLIAGVILANYAGLRTARNLKIAQNELVSNLRKIASYTLSSRAINGTQAVQYYLLKLDAQVPDKYTIEAIYDVTSSPKLAANVETINLPQGIKFSAVAPFVIDRPDPNIEFPNTIPPTGSKDVTAANGNTTPCALVAYKLPFGNIIVNSGSDTLYPSNTGCTFNNFVNDDYAKIKNFVANSPTNTAVKNSVLIITLSSADGQLTKTVTVNGLTGSITFSP